VTKQQLTEVMAYNGYEELSKKVFIPLLFSGMLDKMDAELLDTFFSIYSFCEETEVEEFMYHLQIFIRIYELDKFPVIY
jgi:hypothetical protein